MVGKPEEKRPLGRTACRWEDNIKEVRWKEVGCIRLAQDAGPFEHYNEPVVSIKREEDFNHPRKN